MVYQLKNLRENNKVKNFGNDKEELLISLMNKDNELNKLKSELNQIKSVLPFDLKEGESILPLIFVAGDLSVHYALICKDSEKFNQVENRLYEIFPEYSEIENYFFANGAKINRFKTLKENRLKYSNIVMMREVDN